jgi:hypothetical protein
MVGETYLDRGKVQSRPLPFLACCGKADDKLFLRLSSLWEDANQLADDCLGQNQNLRFTN